jgi:hypothetical protein
MNDALKNPILVFIAGLLAIWLAFKVLKIVASLAWVVLLAFVVLFIINPRFRGIVQRFFAGLFNER